MHIRAIHKIHLPTTPSTHLWVKEHRHEFNVSKITCVDAEEQTAGRGQWGRPFVCAKGNLYFSLYFVVDKKHVPYLSQLLSLSCAEVLKQEGMDCMLKWPNDVLIQGKKCAGVLCDALLEGVILSMGVNLNMDQQLLSTIDQPATSLMVESKKRWDVALFLDKILAQFLNDLSLLETKGFAAFVPSYRKYLVFSKKEIQIEQGAQVLSGFFHAIDDQGHLILRTQEGAFVTCTSGKIKV